MKSIPKVEAPVVDACGERVLITASDIIALACPIMRFRVRGDSMAGDGILDGDYVYCERANEVEEGKIVVAFIDNKLAVVKRYFRKDGLIILASSNPESAEQVYPAERVTIIGVVTSSVRLLTTNPEYRAAGLAKANKLAASEADRS